MDPEYERRLRDEVIYLHSLWHQGPPHRLPPQQQPIPPSRHLHRPTNPPQFKKKERIKPRNKRGLKPTQNQSQLEWPCKPTSSSSPATTSGWPETNSQTLLPSLEEISKLAAKQAQFKALKSTRGFFESSDNDDDSDDDDDELMEKDEYRFFVQVFMEDSELKEYYEKNYRNGEFSCLVCGGLGKKLAGKKFKDCIALVQHSISIAKTRKRRAHRAYGQAVCKVLGWDIARLPTVISELSEKREKLEISSSISGQDDVEDKGKSEAKAVAEMQENVGDETCNASTSLEGKEGSMDVDESGQAEVRGEGVGEGNIKVQDNVSEGTENVSTFVGSKEGSMNVEDSGQREAGSKGKANITQVTGNDLTDLENKEASVDVSDNREIPVKECANTVTLLYNGELTLSEDNSLNGAEAYKSPENLGHAVPEIVENNEAGLPNDGEYPKEECIVSLEGKDVFLDDLVKIDAPSGQESSGGNGSNKQTC